MPKLKKISILIIGLLFVLLLSVYGRVYFLSLITSLIMLILSYIWYSLLTEELIIYHLFKNGKRVEVKILTDLVGKKAKKAIKSLSNKKIVETVEEFVLLKIDEYEFSFTKWRP